jgi:2-methoxy-6-polyprenyl-1,4-benzoquinol methylase
LNYVKNENIEKSCHVTVSDINENMLEVGKTRSRALNHDPTLISWERADGENLHFKDESFNAYTIAFGIRNCTHVDKVLQEAYRVLQPGGRFLCMEFSQVENEVARWLYDQYSFQVIPVMGHLLAGQWQAYQYLVESIRKFPDQETFKTMIEEAGFRQVTYENLSLGVVAIHSGFKL